MERRRTGRRAARGRAAALLVALLAIAGCAPRPAEEPAPAAVPAPAAAPTPPRAADLRLAVDGEGLRVVDARTGAARALPFGQPRDQALAAVQRLRGPATTGANTDCGLDYAGWPDGLTLLFRTQRLVGWSLDRRAAGVLSTMSGVGPGSTRRELESSYAAEVRPSTLGVEFAAGGLAGLLDGAQPDARITRMWAGEACLFR